MTEFEKATLVSAWIAGQAGGAGSVAEEENWWAIEKLMDLPWSDPELAWEVIVRIHNQSDSDEVRGILAASPLEDLMMQHGSTFISRVEELAQENSRFRDLLKGVWLDEGDSVFERFYAAAGLSSPHA